MIVVEVRMMRHNGCHVVTHRPKKFTATFVAFLRHNRTCLNVLTREVLRREAANPIKSDDVVSLSLRKATGSFGPRWQNRNLRLVCLYGRQSGSRRAWS